MIPPRTKPLRASCSENELLPDCGECRQAAVRFAAVTLSSRVILRREIPGLTASDVLRALDLMHQKKEKRKI